MNKLSFTRVVEKTRGLFTSSRRREREREREREINSQCVFKVSSVLIKLSGLAVIAVLAIVLHHNYFIFRQK